jgi:ribosome-binding protein aMBF1 (putative translation factor)
VTPAQQPRPKRAQKEPPRPSEFCEDCRREFQKITPVEVAGRFRFVCRDCAAAMERAR